LTGRYGRRTQALRRPVEPGLGAAVVMVNQAAALDGTAVGQGLLQRVQHESGVGGAAHAPAHDTLGVGVDDEGDEDEALSGRDVGEVRQPQRVRTRSVELPVHSVERTNGGRIADGGADLVTAHNPLQAHPAHQAGHRAPGHLLSLPPEPGEPLGSTLPPYLAHAVDAKVRFGHALDVGRQRQVAPGSRRQLRRVGTPGGMGMISRRGNRQHLADRLDPVGPAVIVDVAGKTPRRERDHRLNGRSSSAWAKYADALRRISLA